MCDIYYANDVIEFMIFRCQLRADLWRVSGGDERVVEAFCLGFAFVLPLLIVNKVAFRQ